MTARVARVAAMAVLIVHCVTSAFGATAGPAFPCPIPLEKGNKWTYQGTIRWTPVNSAPVGPHHLRWEMVVLDVLATRHARAAIVRGMPDDLTWYEPGKQPQYSVLVCVSNMVYRYGAKTEKDARMKARQKTRGQAGSVLNEYLGLPLAEGKEWAADTGDRDDHWYRWYVQQARQEKHPVHGAPSERLLPTWQIAYRTCPDHQVMEVTEGLGITRYQYEHHGTVASVDVRLVSFTRSAK